MSDREIEPDEALVPHPWVKLLGTMILVVAVAAVVWAGWALFGGGDDPVPLGELPAIERPSK